VTILVTIPNYERRFQIAKKSRKTGKPRWWTVNGQGLYNATMHYTLRSKMTKYFHAYLSRYIQEQISEEQIQLIRTHLVSVSLDIYEIKKGMLPDVSNLWLWTKWFEDALQECNVLIDDNCDNVIESGRTRYHWVDSEEKRKLKFNIDFIKLKNSTHE